MENKDFKKDTPKEAEFALHTASNPKIINHLPREIVGQIFSFSAYHTNSFFKNAVLVCKSWRKFLLDEKDSFTFPAVFTAYDSEQLASLPATIGAVLEKDKFITSYTIDLSDKYYFQYADTKFVTDEELQSLYQGLKKHNLLNIPMRLNLYGCERITDKGLADMPSNLWALNVGGCSEVTAEGLVQLPETLRELKGLSLHKIKAETIALLPKNIRYLELLHGKVTAESSQQLAEQLLKLKSLACKYGSIETKALEALPKELKRLSLVTLELADAQNIQPLSQLFPSLQHLNLNNIHERSASELSAEVTGNILSHLPASLEVLKLNGWKHIAEKGLGSLPKTLHTLHLARTDICDKDLQTLSERCPHLKKLNISGCHNVTPEGLKHVARVSINTEHCSNIPENIQTKWRKQEKERRDGNKPTTGRTEIWT